MNSKEFFDKINEEERNKKWYVKIFDFIWYRCILRIKDWPYDIKWWFQKHIRGYSDPDTWDVRHFVIQKVHGPLMKFITDYEEGGMSLPSEFATDPAAWLKILKKIQYAIDWEYKEDEEWDEFHAVFQTWSQVDIEQHYKKVQEGLELFGRYLLALWD